LRVDSMIGRRKLPSMRAGALARLVMLTILFASCSFHRPQPALVAPAVIAAAIAEVPEGQRVVIIVDGVIRGSPEEARIDTLRITHFEVIPNHHGHGGPSSIIALTSVEGEAQQRQLTQRSRQNGEVRIRLRDSSSGVQFEAFIDIVRIGPPESTRDTVYLESNTSGWSDSSPLAPGTYQVLLVEISCLPGHAILTEPWSSSLVAPKTFEVRRRRMSSLDLRINLEEVLRHAEVLPEPLWCV
jgi:hypothetical protein